MATYGAGLYGLGPYGVDTRPGALITEPWQVEWRGVLFGGADADLRLTDLVGWIERPPLRGSNADRSGRHGSFVGRKTAEARTIDVELTAFGDTGTYDLLHAVEDATAYREDPVEEPLAIWAGTDEPHLVLARLEKTAIPTDHAWSVGHHRARLQFVATDPRRYLWNPYTSPALGMPAGLTTGVVTPLVLPVSFGAGSAGGSIAVTNIGNAATWPLFTLTGPLTGPVISTGSGQVLRFAADYTLGYGETMYIDSDQRSVTLAGGVSRRNALVVADWFPLPPRQVTLITMNSTGSYDAAAGLVASFRSSWL